MSAIYPAFEKPLAGSDNFNGNSLSRCLSQLDELAASVKVTPLSRLIDTATLAYEVLDDDDSDDVAAPPAKWFQPTDGLLTTRGLLAAAEQNNVRFQSRGGDNTDSLVAELKQLGELLVAAAACGNRFHLLVDM